MRGWPPSRRAGEPRRSGARGGRRFARKSQAGIAAVACLLLALVLPPTVGAIDVSLDRASVAQAVRIGQSSEPDLERFHSAYRVPVDDPVIRSVEVVSEFRRIVQLTEGRVRLRDATWDAARAGNAAREFNGRLDLVLQLQFSPANTYRTIPGYSLVLYPRGAPGSVLRPVDTRSAASYISAQPAPPGTPILAATVTATFDATQADTSSPVLVGIFLDGREVRRVPVDLGSIR